MNVVIKSRNIPATWKLVPLKELGQWSGGGTPSKSKPGYWENGKIPWVSPKDMKRERIEDSEDHITKVAIKESTAKLISAGSVLIVTRSGILSHTLPVAVTSVPVTVNQDLKALMPKNGILPEYVAWALRTFAREILYKCSKQGTTVNSIETLKLLRFEIPVAPLDQQKRFVAEIEKQFSRLDEAVANLKRTKANLKRYKAAVLKAALEGKLTEAWRKAHPDVEPASKLLDRILTKRRTKWKGKGKYKNPTTPDTRQLPLLPKNWTWATVEQSTSLVTSGSRGWGKYYSETGPLFIRAQDIKTDALNLANVARVNIPEHAEGRRSFVADGDILVTITGANVTKSALVRNLPEQAFISQHVALLKLIKNDISPFLFLWLISPSHGRKILEEWAYGAGKPGLSLEQIRTLIHALPPLQEQQRIVAEVERRFSFIEELEATVEANLTRANRLRQSILQQAFEGKLIHHESLQETKVAPEIPLAAESLSSYGAIS